VEALDIALDVRLTGAQEIGTGVTQDQVRQNLGHTAGLLQGRLLDAVDAVPDGDPADGSDQQ